MENKENMLERAFMRLILERIKCRGLNYSTFAVSVWPDIPKKTAVGKFRELREPSVRTGKCQSLGLATCSRMANVLGEELCYLLVVAEESARRDMRGVAP